MLFIDPAKQQASAAHSNRFNRLVLGFCSALPLINGIASTSMRADWTSVACVIVIHNTPCVVAYSRDDNDVYSYRYVPISSFFETKHVTQFAFRSLISPGTIQNMTEQIGSIVVNMNSTLAKTSADLHEDDVRLASEIYWKLVAEKKRLDLSNMTVAEIFGTGGAIDTMMYSNAKTTRCFQLAQEVTKAVS